jgi:hypothetical protein
MSLPLDKIHELEISQVYPKAIDELELRLEENPNDNETVIRLGFNLWYAITENDRMGTQLPTEQYASRFMQLFHQYHDVLKDNADFCWAFGEGMKMDWYYFPGATEELGQSLIDQACRLDNFYKRFWKDLPKDALVERFKGRGILASYYNVA